ncbi:MAG: Ger(x)C family spore germination protein [Peptococcaceae bacterium]|nr:Ger(x)C family spore germination protein [Peptococcaceae bacterium]
MTYAKWGLVLMISLLLVGCWDQQEITDLASIAGLGFDVGSYPHTVRMSFMTSPPRAGLGGEGGDGSRLRVMTVEAGSFTEALILLQGHIRRQPFFLHLGFILFGEELAKSGLNGQIAALQGRSTIRGSVPIFVAQGTAEEILTARSGIGHAPGQDIADLLDNLAEAPLGRPTTIHNVRNVLGGLGSEITAPILELTPLRLQAGDEKPEVGLGLANEQLREVFVRRLAVFRRDRWVADFDQYLVQTFVLLTGTTKMGSLNITNPADPKSIMGIAIANFQARFEIKIEGDKVEVEILPRVKAIVREVSGSYILRDRGLEPIAQNIEQEVNRQVIAVMSFLQEQKADALGIGDMIRRQQPDVWARLEPRWGQLFPQITVSVNTEAEITSTGMLVRFFEIKRGE